MNEFLRFLVSLSLSGAVLTGFVALLNRLLKRRMPHVFLYYLWLLVLLRFVCPFGSEQSLAHQVVTQPTVVLIEETLIPGSEAEQSEQGSENAAVFGAENDVVHMLSSISFLLMSVWAIGAAAALSWRLMGYRRLMKQLTAKELAVEPWEQELFGKLTGEKRLTPRLLRSAGTGTPVLVGIFRPKLYLPPVQMPETDLQYALRHELVHWERHDLLYKWVVTLTACVHWFNPAAWYLVRAVERDCELSCDECATRGLSLEERRDYGNMLLQAAAYQSKVSGALSASLCDAKQSLQERLHDVMKPNLDSKKARALFAVAVAIVAAASVTVGAYSGQTAAKPGAASSEVETAGTVEDGLAWPFEVDGEIVLSALYGDRIHPITGQANNHSGIDIVLEQGTPVLAAASGVVVTAEYSSTNGNYVVVNHGNMSTIYCHLEKWTVEEGETVASGQQIGTVGKTGMTTGYCLHFEVAVDGVQTDPLNYLPTTEVYVSNGSKTEPLEF